MAYRRKRTKRVFKRKTAKRRGRRPAIKKMIRREIARNIENKTRQYLLQDVFLRGCFDPAVLDATIIPLGPTNGYLQIDQGVGNGSRVGNRIKTKRLTFKGTLFPTAYDAILNTKPMPIQVKMWIFYDKTDPTNNPIPATNGDFFQFNNTASGFTNDLVDLWKPINTDRYRLLTSRIFKLGNAVNTSAGTSAIASGWSNNDFKMNANFSINLTKYYPKNVKFNDNFTDPTSRGLFALFQCVYSNGDAVGDGQRPAKLSWMLDYTYEDA